MINIINKPVTIQIYRTFVFYLQLRSIMTKNRYNILLVGGGATSSIISFLLKDQPNYTLNIWEKESDIGGRMKSLITKKSRLPVDIGAQYITTEKCTHPPYNQIYDTLLSNKILQPLQCTIQNGRPNPDAENFIASNGMSSIVKYMLEECERSVSQIIVKKSRTLIQMNIIDKTVSVKDSTGVQEEFDAVIITLPVPQTLKIGGNVWEKILQANVFENLNEVNFSSRYAVVLVYDKKQLCEWDVKYLPNDDTFRYIAIQERKLGQKQHRFSSVLFHTSIDLVKKYYGVENVENIIIEKAKQHLNWGEPVESYCYKWDYSQVLKPFNCSPGCLVASLKPMVILAGDSFSTSNFDGCIHSAAATKDILTKNLK